MALFEIMFKRRISGYGGPGSPWATECLYLEAASNREANKFFLTLIDPPRNWHAQGLMNYHLGTFYRAKAATQVDASRFSMFSVFKPQVYTQAELTLIAQEARKKVAICHVCKKPPGLHGLDCPAR
jgi:hypothetical protein